MKCPICKGTFNSTEDLGTLTKDVEGHAFQNDCHSGSEVCACSEKNGYPCYRHIDHEYRKLFALNTTLTKENEQLRISHAIDTSFYQDHVLHCAKCGGDYWDEDYSHACPLCENTALTEKFDEAMEMLDNVLYWDTCPQEYVDKILILQGRITKQALAEKE